MNVSPEIVSEANYVQSINGENPYVTLTQWQAEEGIGNTGQWPGNDPAGMTTGNPVVDKLATGKTSGGFLAFPSPTVGAEAYAKMIQTDKNYQNVRQAISTGNPQNELSAIAHSPWDKNHYIANGQIGGKLYEIYPQVKSSASKLEGGHKMPATVGPRGTVGKTASNGDYQVWTQKGWIWVNKSGQTTTDPHTGIKGAKAAVSSVSDVISKAITGVKNNWLRVVIIIIGIILGAMLLLHLVTNFTNTSIVA